MGSAWMPWVRPIMSGLAMTERLRADRIPQAVDPGEQQLGRLHQLQREGRVDHVGRREAEMEIPPFVTHCLRDRRHEGDHVVADLRLDLEHARDVDARVLTERPGGGRRHLAPLGEHIDQGQLDLEPTPEA